MDSENPAVQPASPRAPSPMSTHRHSLPSSRPQPGRHHGPAQVGMAVARPLSSQFSGSPPQDVDQATAQLNAFTFGNMPNAYPQPRTYGAGGRDSMMPQDMRYGHPLFSNPHLPQYNPPAYGPHQPLQHGGFQQPYFAYAQQPVVPLQYTNSSYLQHKQPYTFVDPNNPQMAHLPPITTGFPLYPNPIDGSSPVLQNSYRPNLHALGRLSVQSTRENAATSGTEPQITPRGPPRKPRQSGFALWVGNLPPGTSVIDLKDHFSREATDEIESIKLISKSNCAFVNYKTEAACTAAMDRFQDLRFQGTRLVCRLRRGSTAANSAPNERRLSAPAESSDTSSVVETNGLLHNSSFTMQNSQTRRPERFFVLKSLTLQDLETSVGNGIWATQAHNEKTLNEAYKNSDAVYLIFSANKSGEYFGYARMVSPISASLVAETLPSESPQTADSPTQTSSAAPLINDTIPKSIPTPATEWAPKGEIIDDSARGTIFWEAEVDAENKSPVVTSSEAESVKEAPIIASSTSNSCSQTPNGVSIEDASESSVERQTAYGTMFRVEWLSTRKLPFYRTRGLRNSWNANREVKIARDGTELEPEVGRKLISLFGGPTLCGP